MILIDLKRKMDETAAGAAVGTAAVLKKVDATFVGLTVLDISGCPIRGIPDGGNVAFIDEIKLCPAGTAAGALINAAKLGVTCRTVACLGNDEKADFILNSYRRIGEQNTTDGNSPSIDTSLVQRTTDGTPTSATILPIRPNGDRPALHQRGASDQLWIDEKDFDTICSNTTILHHGGTGLLQRMDETTRTSAAGEEESNNDNDNDHCICQSAKLLKYAKSKGVITTLDLIAPNYDTTMNLLRQILPYVDYFMPSMEEAVFLSSKTSPNDAADFFLNIMTSAAAENNNSNKNGDTNDTDTVVGTKNKNRKTCIFKWGKNGSFIKSSDDGGCHIIPAYKVDVRDTTGCGDSYCGGFIAGLIKYDTDTNTNTNTDHDQDHDHNNNDDNDDRDHDDDTKREKKILYDACWLGTATSALVATGLGSDAGVIDYESTKRFMETTESYSKIT